MIGKEIDDTVPIINDKQNKHYYSKCISYNFLEGT